MPGSTLSTETDFFKNLPPIQDRGSVDIPEAQAMGGQETNTDEQDGLPASTQDRQPGTSGQDEPAEDAGLRTPRPDDGSHAEQPAGEAAQSEPERGEQQAGVPGLTPEETEALRQESHQWKTLSQAYAQDPVSFVQRLAGSLPVHQVEQILNALGPQRPQAQAPMPQQQTALPEFRPDADLTPEELFIKRAAPIVQQVPQIAQQMQQHVGQFRNDVSQAFGTHAQYIQELLYRNAAMEARLNAVLEAQEMALPNLDRQKVEQIVAQGKSYEEAIKAVFKPEADKVVNVKRAAQKPVPVTPLNAANEASSPAKEPNSMYEIFKQAERELAARGRR